MRETTEKVDKEAPPGFDVFLASTGTTTTVAGMHTRHYIYFSNWLTMHDS
jgi:hypothetical protein